MSAVFSNSTLILSAAETGYTTASRALPTAPATTDMMVLYFRAWAENYTAGATGYGHTTGWDNTDCLGLSFTGTYPTRDGSDSLAGKTGFFGLCNCSTAATHALDLVTTPDATWPGDVLEWRSGKMLSGKATSPNTLLTGATDHQLRLPLGAVAGAQFTGVWIIKRALNQQIACSFGRNFESLAPASISLALSSTATIWDATDQLTSEPTNWRPSEGMMLFPSHFMTRYTSPAAGCRLVLDHLKVEFWKYNA